MIDFVQYTGQWKRDSQKPCLSNINLKIKDNSLNAVIGTIGCGKTSLFMSILKEIPFTKGNLRVHKPRVAYVEQEPIIFSGKVKDLITFGHEFDEEKFNRIMKSTGMAVDVL